MIVKAVASLLKWLLGVVQVRTTLDELMQTNANTLAGNETVLKLLSPTLDQIQDCLPTSVYHLQATKMRSTLVLELPFASTLFITFCGHPQIILMWTKLFLPMLETRHTIKSLLLVALLDVLAFS